MVNIHSMVDDCAFAVTPELKLARNMESISDWNYLNDKPPLRNVEE